MQSLRALKAEILAHESAEHTRDTAGRRRFNTRLGRLRAGGGECRDATFKAFDPVTEPSHTPYQTVPCLREAHEFSQAAGHALWSVLKEKIGIMLAGNSGRPAGFIGGVRGIVPGSMFPRKPYETQEESVVQNWLLTQSGGDVRIANSIYQNTIMGKWGMKYPHGYWQVMLDTGYQPLPVRAIEEAFDQGNKSVKYTANGKAYKVNLKNFRKGGTLLTGVQERADNSHLTRKVQVNHLHSTIQGKNYTEAKPKHYYEAWSVDGACLSNGPPNRSNRYSVNRYPAFLTFVAAPNANPTLGKNEFSTTKRTFNPNMQRSYALFKEGVKHALRAGLDAMIQNKVEVAVIPKLGCGIYAGKHNVQINREFVPLVEGVLNEPLPNGILRGRYFSHVVVAVGRPRPGAAAGALTDMASIFSPASGV